MWELDHKEGWALKNWWFQIVVLEKIFASPLDCKEIKPVNPKGNQSWIFIGRADAEAPILWPHDAMNWLIGKDPNAGKDWGQEDNGATEDEMVGWHHWLNSHEFEQTLGDREGQGKPGVLQSVGLQRVGHDWVTEQQLKRAAQSRQPAALVCWCWCLVACRCSVNIAEKKKRNGLVDRWMDEGRNLIHCIKIAQAQGSLTSWFCGSDSKESTYNAGDWVWSLGQEDPLEKGIVTHSSILAWRIPWTEETDGL